MITRRNNTTLFYATTFEAYPDNAKFEIWPVIVDVFQNWIVEKERRQRGNRTPSPARQIDFDISTALKWNQGMRLSAYSALTLRGAMASSLETWGSRKGTTSTKISSSVILGEIQKSLEPWVSNPSDDFMPLRSVRLSKSFAQGTMDIDAPSSSLTTRIMEGDRIPKHWAMDYSEQDSESWWRTWHTCVGITESSVGVYSVTVQVSYSIDPTYMRSDVKTPPRNVPICIRKLLDTEGIACISGEDPLDGNALFIDKCFYGQPYTFNQFYNDLTKPIRNVPLVAVTSDDDGAYPVNPDELARKLTGIAFVVALDKSNKELDKVLEGTFFDRGSRNYAYRPLRHSIQVYFPGLNMDDPRDAKRHYRFSSERISRFSGSICESVASDVIAGSVRAFSQSDKVVACCQDIQNAIDKARRDELASRYREGQGKEERNAERSKLQAQYSKALDELARTQREKNASIEEIAQMSQLLDESMVTIEQKDQEIDDMSEYTSLLEKDIDSKEKKIASLKQELDSVWDIAHESEQLQWRVKSLTEQLQRKEPTSNDAYPLEKMVSLPSSVADALQLATEAFPKKIIALPEAVRSAQAHASGSANETWQILLGLATVLHPLCFSDNPEKDGSITDTYKRMTGYDLSLRESKATNDVPAYVRARRRTYEGRIIDITPHVKGRSGKRGETLRVHFAIDEKTERIVIGHCGAHLDTAGTKRKGF